MKNSRFGFLKRKSVIIIFLVCFMICIGVFMSLRLTSLMHNYMEKQVARQAEKLAEIVKHYMASEIEELNDIALFLTDDKFEMESTVEMKQKSEGKGISYGLLDIDGNALAGQALSMREFPEIRDAFRGNAAVSFHEDKGLVFAVPVFNGYNIHYVLYKRFETFKLADSIDLNCYDGEGKTMVCDDDGNIIVAVKGWEVSENKVPASTEQKLREHLNIHSSSAVFSTYSGGTCFYYIAEVEDTDLLVRGMVPSDVVAEGISYIFSLIIWIYGLLLLLFIIGSVYLVGVEEKARESDELREAKEIAEKASNTRGAFLANMSHEIRTPINAVMSLNEMILRETKEEETRDYAIKIQNASQSLLGIVNDVLDFSKIDSGKMELVPVAYNLVDLIDALVNMVKIRAADKGLVLKLSVSESLPSVLCGDDVRMRQVIVNLLTNAVKYTDRGTVELKVFGNVKKAENGTVLVMRVEVIDTGTGIKQEDIKNLFRTFKRIEESKNRTIEGTGLGLTIASRLLKLMGSELKVESEYGIGSRFYFDVEQEIVDDTAVGDVVGKIEKKVNDYIYKEEFTAEAANILAIDDVDINLFVFKGLLKKTKINIDTALSGKEALEMMAKKKYDLVFVDHMMPEMDGIEVLKRMRQTGFLNESTPAVVFTANAMSGAQEFYLSEGFSDFLEKPVTGQKLETMLQSYLPKEKVEMSGGMQVQADNVASDTEDVSDYPLLDEASGIKFSGSKDIYQKVINTFVGSAKKIQKEINAMLTKCDYDTYVIKVHGLKSSARICGAPKLSKAAEYLEFAGKAGNYDEIHNKHNELISLYQETVHELCKIYDLKTDDDMFKGKMMELPRLAAKLEMLLQCNESFDYDTVDKIMNELTEYEMPEYIKDEIALLKDAVYDIDQMKIDEVAKICIEKLNMDMN